MQLPQISSVFASGRFREAALLTRISGCAELTETRANMMPLATQNVAHHRLAFPITNPRQRLHLLTRRAASTTRAPLAQPIAIAVQATPPPVINACDSQLHVGRLRVLCVNYFGMRWNGARHRLMFFRYARIQALSRSAATALHRLLDTRP